MAGGSQREFLLRALFRPEWGIGPSQQEECSLDHFLLPAV